MANQLQITAYWTPNEDSPQCEVTCIASRLTDDHTANSRLAKDTILLWLKSGIPLDAFSVELYCEDHFTPSWAICGESLNGTFFHIALLGNDPDIFKNLRSVWGQSNTINLAYKPSELN